MSKYELVKEDAIHDGLRTLYRIRAKHKIYAHNPRTGKFVSPGELGGYVESEDNLAQSGDCWLFPDAKALGLARISGHARVFGPAIICGCAKIRGHATVYGPALIMDNAQIYGAATIGRLNDHDESERKGGIAICHQTKIHGNAQVYPRTNQNATMLVSGNIDISGYTELAGISMIGDITMKTPITSFGTVCDWHFHPFKTRAHKLLKKHDLI